MKTAVSSYSFSHLMRTAGETQLTVIEKAKNLGFDAIEFTDLTPPKGESAQSFAARLKAEAQRVGVEISCYSVGADLLTGSDGDLAAEVEKIKEKADIAAALGVSLMRHDAAYAYHGKGGLRSFADVLPRLADGCRQITEYAQTKGIRTMVENHGFFCQDSPRVEALVSAVGHPNFGLLVDMGNFLCADEDPTLAVSRTAPYAFNVHAKDFLIKPGTGPCPEGFFMTRAGNYLRGTVLGHGTVPVAQCVNALKKAGYDGYLTLEFEGMERNEEALRIGSALLRQLCEN